MLTARAIPYLTVDDGPAALGAVEIMRVVINEDTGQLGNAQFHIGGALFYLADEFPDTGVLSPKSLGGTSVILYLEVDDVHAAFSRAIAAGAEAVSEPVDEAHGARQATFMDPFGHWWLLAQQIETVEPAEYADRMRRQGAVVTGAPAALVGRGGIWAALNFADARAGIRFMVDVLGFKEELVVAGERPEVIVHSQLRWPEGGVVQAASANRPGNPFSERPIGTESLYVITADPLAVYQRCLDARAEVVGAPESREYDPEGLVFTIRDPEGNLWSFGTYSGVG